MTKLTDEAVKALLDGATPGPWRADGEPWNRIVWSSADNRVCFMAHSSGLNDARDIATSNLVAAAPDLARALLDARAEAAETALAAMTAREGVLVGALRGLETANDNLCGARPQKIYDAMIAAGMSDRLTELDAARHEARAALQHKDATHG